MQMMQTFLQQLIPVMEQGTALLAPLGVLLAILLELDGGRFRPVFQRAFYWGFWGSVFIVAVKTGTKYAVSREVFESITVVFSIISEVILIPLLLGSIAAPVKRVKLFRSALFTAVIALALYRGMEIWIIPVTTFTTAEHIVSMAVGVRLAGFAVGLFIAIVGSYLIYQAAKALRDRRLVTVFIVQVAALLFQQIVFIIQMLMARQIIPSRLVIKFMAPLIDHQSWFIFIVFLVVLLVPFALFLQKRPDRPEGANPAEYRKIVSHYLHKKRWGTASVFALVIMVCLSSFGSAYANKKETVIPAIPLQAQNGQVKVPLEKVNDGHLHRYSYRGDKGTVVRFIIVRKGGSSYGVGLDACEICGPTGYIERDSQIVCKLCDVVMNKTTIGMPGGCNPIPLKYKIESGVLTVAQEDLDKAQETFR